MMCRQMITHQRVITVSSFNLLFHTFAAPSSTGYFASIYGKCTTNAMLPSFQNKKKLSYIGTIEIVPEVPTDITPLIIAWGKVWDGGVLNLRVIIGARGSIARIENWMSQTV